MIELIERAYKLLHDLYHQHGCAPGAVRWDDDGRPHAEYGDRLVEQLAEAIKAETGSYPTPCHLCRPDLARIGGFAKDGAP